MTNRRTAPSQGTLFDLPAIPAVPEGLRYERNFLSDEEESALVELIQALPLQEMQYKSYTARRRIISYGGQYDFTDQTLRPAFELPDSLKPVRAKAAGWLQVPPDEFKQILVAEYRPGTPLGWHRDVPDFEDIVGISLLGEASLRFRPYPPHKPKKSDIVRVTLEPRSIYVLRGPARWGWQHSVAPTASLRYSITFRTARHP